MNIDALKDRLRVGDRWTEDIKEHLPYLMMSAIGKSCVVEFGTRSGNSTLALIAGQSITGGGKLHSYDIEMHESLELIDHGKTDWMFYEIDAAECAVSGPVDLLFIDSFHSYDQVKAEMEAATRMQAREIIFHDTVLFGKHGQRNTGGIMPAIREFMEEDGEWVTVYKSKATNGLLHIKKRHV